ncbi:MAG: hypothetical protein K2M55_00300 [Muribaculaceae bacterium]|nr:hypothetical protein [Muribaculaceae bacterium]
MKAFLFVWIFLIGLVGCRVQSGKSTPACDTEDDEKEYTYEDFIRVYQFNDTILDIIDGNEIIFFSTGHHGYSWTMAVSRNGYYVMLGGSSRDNNLRIDTIITNNPILDWAIDSLAIYGREMKQPKNDGYITIYQDLLVFSADKKLLFEGTNLMNRHFVGPDLKYFYDNFGRLYYYMFYYLFSEEELKSIKLPSPKRNIIPHGAVEKRAKKGIKK